MEARDARAVSDVELMRLDNTAAFTRRGHQLQTAVRIGQYEAGRCRIEEADALLDKGVQEVDDIVFGDESVCEGDEHSG
ncbi:MAG TPA: hypothetical protein VIJ18_17705 [Microbacteriaceae bacterium]